MDYETTTYTTTHGTRHDAIRVSWGHIEDLFGHPHTGAAEEDEALVDQLLLDGAPDWVRGAEGWIDGQGWGLIGPEQANDED